LAPGQVTALPLLKTLVISTLFFKRSRRLNRRLPGGSIGLLFVGNGQFRPSLGPAALEHKPPATGFHPRPEPKFAVPFNFTGLISPLHEINSSIYRKLPGRTIPTGAPSEKSAKIT
jgi:hypothetical protein